MNLKFKFPDFQATLSKLNTAQISSKHPALYETIKDLITKSQQLKTIQDNLNAILSQVSFGSQGELIINTATLGPFTSAQLAALCLDETGSAGHLVFSTDPIFGNDIAVGRDVNLTRYLSWGNTISSPMLRAVGAEIEARLGDDSLFTSLEVSRIIADAFQVHVSPAGAINWNTLNYLHTADAGGTTDSNALQVRNIMSGANAAAGMYGMQIETRHSGSALLASMIGYYLISRLTDIGNVTNAIGMQYQAVLSNTGAIVNAVTGFRVLAPSISSTGDITGFVRGFQTLDISRATASGVRAIDIGDLTKAVGDTIGAYLNVAAATGKWNIKADGTAQNHLRGNLGIGSGKTVPAYSIDSAGQINGLSYGCGVITTTATGAQNDFVINANGELRCNNATDLTITGIVAGIAGQRLRIISIGAGNVFLAHLNGGSVAANQLFNITRSANTPLAAGSGVAEYEYDATSAVWRLVSHVQGAVITPTFAAGEYTGNGAMTWTVVAGDILTMGYMLSGRQLTVFFEVNATTTIGGVANTTLIKTIPGGFTTNRQSQQPCIVSDPGVGALGFGKCFVTAGGTNLNFRAGAAAPVWGAGATAGMNGVVNCEVQ